MAPYQRSNHRLAINQLLTSVVPYLALWVLMVLSLKLSYFLTLALAVPAAGFLVRIFIIFHDCGHNSFFRSPGTNRVVGFWLGILVFTPGEQWWHSHSIHHASAGNLDKRGIGDVETLTVEEYQALTPIRKLGYRLFRHPLVMFGLGPIWMFLISHRLPLPRFGKKETMSVIHSDIALGLLVITLCLTIGWQAYLMIQLPVIWLAGLAGIWLFYIQHQYREVYWSRSDRWEYLRSSILGASCYQLPRLLKWFSGNIGYHHLHHLSPRIPSYHLDRCFHANEILQHFQKNISFGASLRCIGLALIDEKRARLIRFNELQVSTG
jgi:acyl-lipid omega-6 desaturase (Delta-12 desaturase)